jgi:hypothetical protein
MTSASPKKPTDQVPTYTSKGPATPSSQELREKIPGWGVDLDPTDRPSVPQERFDPDITGAHWDFPERQEERWPRERSIEHRFLTPVFGTSTPPSGVSGVIRKVAYRYSEARAAHWLLLLGADRVNAVEFHIASLFTTRPDNPITQTGIRSEFTHHGLKSRTGTARVDKNHAWMDPIIVGGPWVAAGAAVAYSVRAVLRRVP